MDKNSLRKYIKTQRDMLDNTQREVFSRAVMGKIINLKSFTNAKTIMCFASFGSEIDTFPIIRKIISEGKTLVLPKVEKCKDEKVLGLYMVDSPEGQLVKGVFGIMEPDIGKCRKACLADIDLCICPGVVFDRKCNRIGYGGGFYDRLLSCNEAKCKKVGIAFDMQVVDSIAPDMFDIPMDVVITEKNDYKA